MKKGYIVAIVIAAVLIAGAAVFIYERSHAALYMDGESITIVGESDGPTAICKQAAEKLVALGYSNSIEFGGIIDWTGEIEK